MASTGCGKTFANIDPLIDIMHHLFKLDAGKFCWSGTYATTDIFWLSPAFVLLENGHRALIFKEKAVSIVLLLLILRISMQEFEFNYWRNQYLKTLGAGKSAEEEVFKFAAINHALSVKGHFLISVLMN